MPTYEQILGIEPERTPEGQNFEEALGLPQQDFGLSRALSIVHREIPVRFSRKLLPDRWERGWLKGPKGEQRRPTDEEAQLLVNAIAQYPDRFPESARRKAEAIVAQTMPKAQQLGAIYARQAYGALNAPTLGVLGKTLPGLKEEIYAVPGAAAIAGHEALTEAGEDITGLAGELVVYGGLFKGVGKLGKVLGKAVGPRLATAVRPLMADSGSKAERFIRLLRESKAVSVGRRAVGGAAKGLVVGEATGRVQAWTKGLKPEEAAEFLATRRKWFVGMGAAFEGVAQVDRLRLAGRMKAVANENFAKARATVLGQLRSETKGSALDKHLRWTYKKLWSAQNLYDAQIDKQVAGITRTFPGGEQVPPVTARGAVVRHAGQAPGFRQPEVAVSRIAGIEQAQIGPSRLAPKVDIDQLANDTVRDAVQQVLGGASVAHPTPGAEQVLAEQLAALEMGEVPGEAEQVAVREQVDDAISESAAEIVGRVGVEKATAFINAPTRKNAKALGITQDTKESERQELRQLLQREVADAESRREGDEADREEARLQQGADPEVYLRQPGDEGPLPREAAEVEAPKVAEGVPVEAPTAAEEALLRGMELGPEAGREVVRAPGEVPAEPAEPAARARRREAPTPELDARVQEIEDEIAAERKRAEAPPEESEVVKALEQQRELLQGARMLARGVPEQYTQELAAKTPRQLAADVGKAGKKATPQEKELAQQIRDAARVEAELKGQFKPRRGDEPRRPVMDALKGEKKIGYLPGFGEGTEIAEFLQGQPRSISQFFKKAKDEAELRKLRKYDEAVDELSRARVLPDLADLNQLFRALEAESQAPTGWWGNLRETMEEERQDELEADRLGEPFEPTVANSWDRLQAAYNIRDEAASELRDIRAARLAEAAFPDIAEAARQLDVYIAEAKRLEAVTEKAEKKAYARRVKALEERKANLVRAKAKDAGFQQIRRQIAILRERKGISKARFQRILADNTQPFASGKRRTSTAFVTDKPTLLKIWAAVERARPKKIGSTEVFSAQQERNIVSLRKQYVADGGLTDEDWARQLQETTGGRAPRYLDAENFITPDQAHELIKAMQDDAPLIRHKETVRQAVAASPQIAAVVAQDEVRVAKVQRNLAKKGKKANWRYWLDFQHQLSYASDVTGEPFLWAGMDVVEGGVERSLAVARDFDQIRDAVGAEAYKRIAADPAALDRIGQYVASQAPVRYKPPAAPTEITADEIEVAKAVERLFVAQRNQLRFERFENYWLSKKQDKIPDAKPNELRRAVNLYEGQGPEAAREYLDTLDWGVIHGGYDPWMVVFPKIRYGGRSLWSYGRRQRIEVREGEWQPLEQHILSRLNSYLRQRYAAKYVRPRVRTLTRLWDRNAQHFRKASSVADGLGAVMSHISGVRPGTEPLLQLARGIYSHALLVRVLLSPFKWARNAFQPMIFYTDRTDFLHNLSVTPE